MPKRSADRPRHLANGYKCTTPVVAKQVQAAWPPTGNRRQIRQTPSASSGTALGGRASTSDSSGQDPTPEARRVPVTSEVAGQSWRSRDEGAGDHIDSHVVIGPGPLSSVVGVRLLPYTRKWFPATLLVVVKYCQVSDIQKLSAARDENSRRASGGSVAGPVEFSTAL